MRARISTLSFGAATVMALWILPAIAEDTLRLGGTGGATALLAHLGVPFTQQTGIAVEVIPSLGSGGAISAVADGVLDVVVSGRPLSISELQRGVIQVAALRTPYVFATSHPAPHSMSESKIVNAYGAAKATWPDGSIIKLILRPRAESDNQVLMALFPGMTEALDRARTRAELPIAATDQDNADLAERLTGSLIGTTYTQVVMEVRKLRLIPIDGVTPTIDTFASGAYRYTKVLYVAHQQQPSVRATRFLQFMLSDEGIRAMRAAGCLPGPT